MEGVLESVLSLFVLMLIGGFAAIGIVFVAEVIRHAFFSTSPRARRRRTKRHA